MAVRKEKIENRNYYKRCQDLIDRLRNFSPNKPLGIISDTKEFIIGIPKEDMLEKLYKAGEKFDKNISEFEKVNLTPYKSKQLKCMRIEECIVNIDCIFENEIATGNHHIIVGKVIGCDIDKDKYSDDKVLLRGNIPNIYHITGNKFMIDGEYNEI